MNPTLLTILEAFGNQRQNLTDANARLVQLALTPHPNDPIRNQLFETISCLDVIAGNMQRIIDRVADS